MSLVVCVDCWYGLPERGSGSVRHGVHRDALVMPLSDGLRAVHRQVECDGHVYTTACKQRWTVAAVRQSYQAYRAAPSAMTPAGAQWAS